MGRALSSIDTMLALAQEKGLFTRYYMMNLPSVTSANTTSGYQLINRAPEQITLPSLGSGVTGAYFPYIRMTTSSSGVIILCVIEYSLGQLTISGNTFAAGVTMPVKQVFEDLVQTSSLIPVLVVTTALTATTPVITITYTDQDGNTGNTATLTLPTSPVLGTGFLITPHLAAGDTGIRAITNLSTSAGTAGVLKVFGLLPLGFGGDTSNICSNIDPLTMSMPIFKVETSEVIAFYSFGSASSHMMTAVISGVADN